MSRAVEAVGGRVTHELGIIRAVGADLTPKQLAALRDHADVRRIFDNLYMHSFKTSEGYIPVVVGVSISAADASTGFPHPKHFMRHAYDGLTRSFDTGLITVQPFDPSHRSGI